MTDSRSAGDRDPSPRPGPPVVTIRCRADGPLVIEVPAAGDAPGVVVRVTDHRGREFPLPTHKRAVALCRCGQSRSRPFCDGSHRETGFTAADPAPEPGSGQF
jgi:CDGSH-type Zn-finger protein